MTAHPTGGGGAPPSPAPRETTNAMLIALILLSVTLAAVAQLTLKYGMDRVTASSGVLQLEASSLRAVATTPTVWLGLFLFALSAFVWLAVLSRTSLLLADRFLLDQEVPALRWAGVAFIAVGIVLVAQTRQP